MSLANAITNTMEARKIPLGDYGIIVNHECPLDVLVPTRESRRYGKQFVPHLWGGGIQRGAFRRVAKDIYISSPEFLYVQLASEIDEIELARLALELCGTYRLVQNMHYRRHCPALTSTAKLARFIERSAGSRGASKARSALRWVADNSASPQETNMLLALCLPQRWGGYSLPLPELNPELPVNERMRPYVEGDVYKPDCYWVRERHGKTVRITAEYDSDECHGTPEDAERTRIRRNAFKTMGYLVTSVNLIQMRSATNFQYPARQIARDLGLARPNLSFSELAPKDELLRSLSHESLF
ncbi:MAG: hypothetical protein Q4B54_12270 [Coriobacteriales bacterium]|nr:hypothetical protein [Coriobacteriales bacterium]